MSDPIFQEMCFIFSKIPTSRAMMKREPQGGWNKPIRHSEIGGQHSLSRPMMEKLSLSLQASWKKRNLIWSMHGWSSILRKILWWEWKAVSPVWHLPASSWVRTQILSWLWSCRTAYQHTRHFHLPLATLPTWSEQALSIFPLYCDPIKYNKLQNNEWGITNDGVPDRLLQLLQIAYWNSPGETKYQQRMFRWLVHRLLPHGHRLIPRLLHLLHPLRIHHENVHDGCLNCQNIFIFEFVAHPGGTSIHSWNAWHSTYPCFSHDAAAQVCHDSCILHHANNYICWNGSTHWHLLLQWNHLLWDCSGCHDRPSLHYLVLSQTVAAEHDNNHEDSLHLPISSTIDTLSGIRMPTFFNLGLDIVDCRLLQRHHILQSVHTGWSGFHRPNSLLDILWLLLLLLLLLHHVVSHWSWNCHLVLQVWWLFIGNSIQMAHQTWSGMYKSGIHPPSLNQNSKGYGDASQIESEG